MTEAASFSLAKETGPVNTNDFVLDDKCKSDGTLKLSPIPITFIYACNSLENFRIFAMLIRTNDLSKIIDNIKHNSMICESNDKKIPSVCYIFINDFVLACNDLTEPLKMQIAFIFQHSNSPSI